jgi:hypothetical protein
MVAPGQKLRIAVDIGDQGKHLLGAVPDQHGLVNGFHVEWKLKSPLRAQWQLY